MTLSQRDKRRLALGQKAYNKMLVEKKTITQVAKELKTTVKTIKKGWRLTTPKVKSRKIKGRTEFIGHSRSRPGKKKRAVLPKYKWGLPPTQADRYYSRKRERWEKSHSKGERYEEATAYFEERFDIEEMDPDDLEGALKSTFSSSKLHQILLDRYTDEVE